MLNYNEVKQRSRIIVEDEPWEVVEAQVSRKQQNKPVNKTKLKNMISGRVIEYTFHVSDRVHEAEVEKRDMTYLYYQDKKGEYWFADADNPKNRFTLAKELIGDGIKYMTENSTVIALVFRQGDGEQIIGIEYPMKVELAVTEAPPNIKGDTATGGRKVVTVETGATVNAPLFINTGDVILVNTETGDYSERVEKN
ncbi:elongation factor P [Candidatus Nomurabacteria bacterium]|nr:elongation factor P [Candidatus Nomurabacteria bacterium]